ncbi:MAG: WbqC family protein [Nitrospira sp.]
MASSKIVAIHQPNFFPWLGYFNKLARADVFIVLDNVQFPKTGGTWMNRVRLLMNGEPDWISMPVVRSYHGTRLIHEMKINNSIPWRKKLLKTINLSYGRAPFHDEVVPLLSTLMGNSTDDLREFNLDALRVVGTAIGLDPGKLILGSTLDVKGEATDLLIAMVQAVGGTAYLCGGGAGGYQEDEKFAVAGIQLIYQSFAHPTYSQVGSEQFCAGLSVIDVAMNCGFKGVRRLIVPTLT